MESKSQLDYRRYSKPRSLLDTILNVVNSTIPNYTALE